MQTSKFPSLNEQMDLIKRGTVEIIPEDELAKKIENSIKNNKPLRIKLGCDPTRPDLHLGHSVVLRKLAQFQSLGHQAVLIIGDFTGMIGDPTGRNVTRPPLTLDECKINANSYIEQAAKILDIPKTEIRYNSEWLGQMKFEDVIKLAAKYTVARMLERDDFNNRFKSGIPISMHEILYPLAQGMDSVYIKSDVELGGTDQKFNLLVGRDLQREYGQEPQIILTMPLLVGTDGKEKMSKSLDNYIGIDEEAAIMYEKAMKIPDDVLLDYFRLTTDIKIEDAQKLIEEDIVLAHKIYAREIIKMYHGEEKIKEAEERYNLIATGGVPKNIEDILFDPQTSGGLLISVKRDKAELLLEKLSSLTTKYAVVGEVIEKQEYYLYVE